MATSTWYCEFLDKVLIDGIYLEFEGDKNVCIVKL